MIQYRIEVDCIHFTQILHQISQNMKLHLPKKLFAALMAVFAITAGTTLGSDVISINFGSKAVDADSTGDVGGVTAAYWTNINAAVNNHNVLGAGGTTYNGVLTVSTTQSNFAWQSGIADAGTVLSDVQSSYMDLSADTQWTVNLNLTDALNSDLYRVDVTIYLSGDGNTFSPVTVAGANYIGGTDVLAGATTAWGDRSSAASATQGAHNTLTVTDVGQNVTMSNVMSGDAAKRATLAGMQISVKDIYQYELAAGSTNSAEAVTWTGPTGASVAYADLDLADRLLRANVTAGDAALSFASGAQIEALQVTGGNVLTLTSDGSIDLGSLSAAAGTTVKVGDVFADDGSLVIGGEGDIEIVTSQTLGSISGNGSTLTIADGVKVTVNNYAFDGTVIGGTDSALNITVAVDSSSTVNGITVTNNLGEVGINALASGITDVTASDGARIGISSAGGTLLVNGAEGSSVRLTSLELTAANETKLQVAEGVTLNGANLGQFFINTNGRILTVGEGVSLTFSGSTAQVDQYAIAMANGTLNVAGGHVAADSLVMQNRGGAVSYLNVTDGGLLEITGTQDSGYKSGSVRLAHWGGNPSALTVASQGEFRVLGATICMSDDGAGNLIVKDGGMANLKGITRLTSASSLKVSTGGMLNIGVSGIAGDGVINVDGAILGALDAAGWSSGLKTNIGNGSTIYLATYDVESGQYTETAADITLSGAHSGTGALTLAGSGKLVISSALLNQVGLAEGSTAQLVINGVDGFEVEATAALSGYGESTTDGYAAGESFRIAAAGSTLDSVTLITTTTTEEGDVQTETQHALTDGLLELEYENPTAFYVNTEVTRSLIDEVKEGTTYALASGAIYHTNVVDDLGVLETEDSTSVVYLQSEEGKDLIKLTDVPNNWKPNLTIEGDVVKASAAAYTADFTVLSGATLYLMSSDGAGVNLLTDANRVITIDGGTFDVAGCEAYYHIAANEGSVIKNSTSGVGLENRSLPILDLNGNITIHSESQFGMIGSGYAATDLNLNGYTLTKTGAGNFHMSSTVADKGTIRIEEGRVQIIERNANNKSDFTTTSFEVCNNSGVKGTLEVDVTCALGELVANGGTVEVNGATRVATVNKLTGSAFDKQGDGSLALASGIQIADDVDITVGGGSITLAAIEVAEGKTLNIAGAVVAEGLSKTGAGALTIDALSGSISYVSLTGNATIESLTGATTLDFIAIADQLTDGINLGIKYTDENIAQLEIIAMDSSTYELVDDNGYIKLQAVGGASLEVKTDWDINWGGAGLAGAPETLTELTAGTGDISLDLAPTLVVGGGDGNGNLVGGKSYAEYDASEAATGDVWIKVSGGSFQRVIGGSMCNNWRADSGNSFEGDVHIVVDGGNVGTVIGTHFNDAKSPTFNGDTYISIMEGAAVSGSVVGSGTMSHNEGVKHTGDTNVFVYTTLTGSGYVLGGHMWLSNYTGTMTTNGATNVTVDLSEYTGSGTTFAKHIVGASYLSNDATWYGSGSPQALINGDTNVVIKGKEGVTFTGMIAGASFTEHKANSTVTGSTNINISGNSEYEGIIAGGTIFNKWVTAFPESAVGAVNMQISGGTFNERIIGGDALLPDGQMKSNVGDVTMTISSGTFNANVMGGSYKGPNGGGDQIIKVGSVNMVISGGSMAAGKTLLGGSWLSGTGNASLGNNGNLAMGDINLTITDGSWQNILGGSYVERNNNHYMTQGDIVIDLQGGSVAGDIYAAGRQVNNSYLTTESTTVKVGSGVTLTVGKTVSAGYHDTNAGANHSSVAGDRTILFTGDADQDRVGINFTGFNKIGVESSGKVVTIGGAAMSMDDALTVVGEGTIKLTTGTALTVNGGATIEAGATVDLGGNSVTGDVVVNGSLITAGDTAINGDLTLAAGSNLTLWDGATDSANGMLDMTAPVVEGASLLGTGNALTIGGLFGLDVKVNPDGEVELITGIDSITGIEFDSENKVLAGDVLSGINGGEVDSKLYLVFEDGTLKLSAIAGMTEFYWEDTDTTTEKWSEKLWSVKDNNGENLVTIKDAATRNEEVNAIFNNGKAETVLVDTTATVDDLTVSGAGSNYTFAADTTNPGSLTIEGKLTVTDSATATFDGDLADVGAAELEVSGGAALTAGDVTIAGDAILDAGTVNAGAVVAGSLTADNGSILTAGDLELAGTAEITGSTVDAAGLLTAAGVVISGDTAKVEAERLKVGEDGLVMSGGTLNAGSLFSGVDNATAEITGGTVTIGGSTLSATTVTDAEFVGESTLAGSDSMAVTVGDITVDSAAELTLSDATLTGGITVEDGGTLALGGAMHLDTSASDFGLENKSTYAATADASDLGKEITDGGNGFVSRNEIYTVVDGSLTNVDSQVSTWTVGADAREGEYANGKVTISESKDTSTYWVNSNVTLGNVSDNFVDDTDTIKLNGGVLQMNEATDLTIATNNENPKGTESTLALQNGVTLGIEQLSIADGTTLVLRGQSDTTLDLGAAAGVDSTKLTGLGEDTWLGTVTTSATDITDVASLGNADSTVELTGAVDSGVLDLGSVGTVHATDSLTVEGLNGTGDLQVDGLTTLKKGSGSIGNAAFDGGLVLGSEEAADLVAAELTAASVEVMNGSIDADTLVVGDALSINDGSVTVDSLTVDSATTLGSEAESSLMVNGDATLAGGLTLDNGSTAEIAGELNLGDSALKFTDLDSLVKAGSIAGDELALEVDTDKLKAAVDAGVADQITLLEVAEDSSDVAISLNGGSNILSVSGEKYSYSLDWDAAGQNVVLGAVANENYMKEKYAGAAANAKAGATLMDDAFASGATGTDADLANILGAVDKGTMTEEGLAAVAGSSTAALGMAFSGDVERQLRSIRNRTTTMGVNQCVVNEGMPYFNAWVNAEGNFGEMDKDGLASGYKLDSWGGTVGFDVDVNPNLTLGLALTAMYGDLTVDGPDMLDGDMDTFYVSAFARYSSRAWTHTFIGTIGMMDSSYERTVSHAGGKYTTEGDTDGMAFGLMYEVGRVFAIDEDGDACWQPIFNVAYRHTNVGGYTEKGGAAALKVDDQTLDTITLGAGARVQAVVGENIFNRTSVFEARALAKFDIGDTSSEADVAFIGGGRSAMVESAELGAFGVELGAGLSVPVGDENDGTIFFDVSAELRSGYTEFNGTVGYRINF